ncbi:unnamed protein product [Owenia fusiformis]|uniref:Uncharacterized protein n=1 Tax=Owenia fusiformis TaxID=6347 RepID=A0A8S4Q8E4_OWEFU|nr:unnamed protein product [Owenia fusiformis]
MLNIENFLETPQMIGKLDILDPSSFLSGQLHNKMRTENWCHVLKGTQDRFNVKNWLNNGIDIKDYMKHFKGQYKGKIFDSPVPPKMFMPNSPSCKDYSNFISKTLEEKIESGAIRVIGKVVQCQLPKVVMPLIVEQTKPRLCHDERFINLWMKDMPFELETLKDVPRMVGNDSVLFCCDEKSSYDHVKLKEESQTYFGVVFAGWVAIWLEN